MHIHIQSDNTLGNQDAVVVGSVDGGTAGRRGRKKKIQPCLMIKLSPDLDYYKSRSQRRQGPNNPLYPSDNPNYKPDIHRCRQPPCFAFTSKCFPKYRGQQHLLPYSLCAQIRVKNRAGP